MVDPKTQNSSVEDRADWADEAERDFSEIIPARAPSVFITAPAAALLMTAASFSYPGLFSPALAGAATIGLVLWALALRRLSRPSVAGFWSAAALAIIAFCGGLIAAINRENPLEAVTWSMGASALAWLGIMSLPWRRPNQHGAEDPEG